MDIQEVKKVLENCAAEPFRLKQAARAVFARLISDWDEASDLPIALREQLKKQVLMSSLTEIARSQSARGDATKLILRTSDGLIIETVLMKHQTGRNTVCVSTQAGCPMQCAFCATGQQGFKRNLTSAEILDQVLHFARELNQQAERVSSIVFMGMGEPFHNYDAVLDAISTLNAADGLNIGARHISISTCGIIPGIERLAKEARQINLAISLHAPTDDLRDKLMPVNKTYPLSKLLPAIRDYLQHTNRKVMFEYLLIEGVNDSQQQADQLADLLADERLYHVNLIRFHRTGNFSSSSREKRDNFFDRLKQRGVSVTHRVSFGEDIQAACGMLAGKINS
ncbi:23S rRNA (adenine(2503)-C(2))-methyltransferase RlmN [Patescibacteria group bacterium]|nr:23S rRNA (adenine(2503)-C(2))-methyltransferase RlmN [Patescibacteria group bacterium]MBU1028874.1 23S rRNA (adenine(2503)-C(2))-methyltransferase RlmN [Patescibacteria group bacterium]MBU1915633.1 23S rRNA (adenine(2503)-C(2))-methyltransferase RlmN [Patescibacteria group bacterium]